MARSLFLPRHPHSGAGSCGEVTVTAGICFLRKGRALQSILGIRGLEDHGA